MTKIPKIVCIIPARSGSKRIKNKNIINFNGKPLIYYSIKAAKESKLFDRIIVTTDSKKIKNIAIKYGAEVPFIRAPKFSGDKVGIKPVICDCIKKINTQKLKHHFIVYATNPLINAKNLINAYKKIIKLKSKILIGVKKYDTSPIKAISIKKNKLFFLFKKKLLQNSQNYADFFYDDGSFSILETKSYLKRKNYIANDTTYFLHKENESLDLNTMDDLIKLKKIYRSRFKPQN